MLRTLNYGIILTAAPALAVALALHSGGLLALAAFLLVYAWWKFE